MMGASWNVPTLSTGSATPSTNASTVGATPSSNSPTPSSPRTRRPFARSPEPGRRRIVAAGAASTPRSGGDASTTKVCGAARPPSARARGSQTPVYAVDSSVWPRCDAEVARSGVTTTTHPATPPASPSWPDGLTSDAQLDFVRESWTAPVDVSASVPRKTPMRSPPTGEGLAGAARGSRVRSPIRLRRGLRSRQATAGASRGVRTRSSSVCAPGVASTAILASPVRPRMERR